MEQTNEPRKSKVDMSPEGIDRRLREVGQLYELGMSLRKARRLGKIERSSSERQRDSPSRSS
jgi:hypothetical protein